MKHAGFSLAAEDLVLTQLQTFNPTYAAKSFYFDFLLKSGLAYVSWPRAALLANISGKGVFG